MVKGIITFRMEKTKINGKQIKENFLEAVKDKRRWLMCLLELLIVGVLIAADLLTKKYVYGLCVENGKIDIIKGVLSLTAVENTGASFGIFANHTTALTVVS
ncbi:MAG: signal peptidase II, partial [Clostridia bacterium]|nr:signal peptidase II [Clostridia bacterium]